MVGHRQTRCNDKDGNLLNPRGRLNGFLSIVSIDSTSATTTAIYSNADTVISRPGSVFRAVRSLPVTASKTRFGIS